MTRPAVIGIDPGASGGIAVLQPTGESMAAPIPATERDTWRLFQRILEANPIAVAVIERVHSMPGQGVSSTFKFGQSYGFLRGLLIAADVPFEAVTPGVWQRRLGLIGRRGESNTDKKNRHKARAQELWPLLRITHAIADALLIAEWGRLARL